MLDDNPVVEADIRVWPIGSDASGVWLVSDERGRFHVPSFFSAALSIEIAKEGFVTLDEANVVVPSDSAIREFVLIPKR